MNFPDELGAGAARARPNPTLLSPIVCLSLLGNHEDDFRTERELSYSRASHVHINRTVWMFCNCRYFDCMSGDNWSCYSPSNCIVPRV